MLFANLNILAKRARHAGLPVWATAIALSILSGASFRRAGPVTSGEIGFLLMVILNILTNKLASESNLTPAVPVMADSRILRRSGNEQPDRSRSRQVGVAAEVNCSC